MASIEDESDLGPLRLGREIPQSNPHSAVLKIFLQIHAVEPNFSERLGKIASIVAWVLKCRNVCVGRVADHESDTTSMR